MSFSLKVSPPHDRLVRDGKISHAKYFSFSRLWSSHFLSVTNTHMFSRQAIAEGFFSWTVRWLNFNYIRTILGLSTYDPCNQVINRQFTMLLSPARCWPGWVLYTNSHRLSSPFPDYRRTVLMYLNPSQTVCNASALDLLSQATSPFFNGKATCHRDSLCHMFRFFLVEVSQASQRNLRPCSCLQSADV